MTSTGLSAVSCAEFAAQPASAPATATVTGAVVRIRAPYALGLRRGARASAINAAVGSEPLQVNAAVGATTVSPAGGDLAATKAGLALR
jgi:hypothetical protein